ncbi:MAG TPA: N-acetylmuramoyl-L-alanine amidase [Gemmatimonadaceae bacterium]|jgi:N-acetylmuramoyl-L-alanine amidase
MIRPEALPFPVQVRRDSASYYTLEIYGARLQLQVGVPVVRTGDDTIRLVCAPIEQGGKLLVPLQLVSDVFPYVVPNTRWDADAGQLIVFGSTLPAANAPVRQVASERAANSESSPRTRTPTPDANLPPIPVKHFRRTIIVDAGHGGVDNGMTGPIGGGPKIYEKNITLAVSKRLGAELQQRGVDVVYTRTTDTLIALDDRGRIANRAQGDLFISIHVNAANPNWKDPGGSRGFETYFLSEARTEDARRVEQMENDATRFETVTSKVDKDDPLSFILSDMQQNEHLRESSELAALIQSRLGKMHPGPSRGVKQAGFRVLVTSHMPAVLVEIGFGTNAREAQYISDPNSQTALANAIADAATEYLDRYERRVAGTRAGAGPAR